VAERVALLGGRVVVVGRGAERLPLGVGSDARLPRPRGRRCRRRCRSGTLPKAFAAADLLALVVAALLAA
jgi:hypothetical protein